MNDWIKWCPLCKARILTTRQMEEGKPCEPCQKEHAATLKDRVKEAQKEEGK